KVIGFTGVIAAVAILQGQQPPASIYTAEQATAGRAAYQQACASCHMPDLSGRNEAPPLAGGTFMNTWRTRTTKDLFDYMSATMPPNVGSLSADQYAAITAFIIQTNGAPAGTRPLTPATAVAIGSAATGALTNIAQAPQQGRANGPGGGPGRGGTVLNGPTGLILAGEVKNYAPVTDEMLR